MQIKKKKTLEWWFTWLQEERDCSRDTALGLWWKYPATQVMAEVYTHNVKQYKLFIVWNLF